MSEAPKFLGILWTFQVIAFTLVGLRLYTRLVVLHNYGIDDHFFNFAVFWLFVYVILMTVAACYGLGQTMTDPASFATSRALLLVAVGQTVTAAAVISIKISIAFFLLRIVGVNTAHRVAIIVPVALMVLSVFVGAWLIWFSCTPVSYVWDITVPGGHCNPITQFWAGLVSGVMIIAVELWYASFPWYLIRGLQMPRREKILIGSSMSVSYISAACGVFRLLNLLKLADADDSDFLLTIVDILIWHAADVTTQLLCIGVTVCRPLYKDWLNRVADHIEGVSNPAADTKQDSTYGARKAPDLIALRTIGGSAMEATSASVSSDHKRRSLVQSSRRPSSTPRRSLVFRSDATSEEPTLIAAESSEPEKTIPPGQRLHV
ncbi:hypothetical protein N8I77_012043 [Diaporthe amygdali]|uniref:Rhodopsin domain-containing protein n=1 Tax=Phomopsis amygdali TaxID=1214568 RepID=A0AAD9VZI0_PHOAM|nr:hypothetical protein N8I77_012043 [Diaporthe amygdali]